MLSNKTSLLIIFIPLNTIFLVVKENHYHPRYFLLFCAKWAYFTVTKVTNFLTAVTREVPKLTETRLR